MDDAPRIGTSGHTFETWLAYRQRAEGGDRWAAALLPSIERLLVLEVTGEEI